MKISLAILTLNEIVGLKSIFERIPTQSIDEVYAVDGGSTDGTVEFLREKGITVYQQDKKGRGEAFQIAFQKSTGEAIVFFSPDGNEDPADIPKFKDLAQDGIDMVIGTRMVSGASNEEDIYFFRWRKWANLFFTWIANVTWNRGPYVTDTINGYRLVTRKAWEKMNPNGSGYTIEYQSTIRAFKNNLKIVEFATHEGHRIDQRPGSPSIQTGISFLMLYLKELRVR